MKTRVEYAIGGEPRIGTDDFGAFDYEDDEQDGYEIDVSSAIADAAKRLAQDAREGGTAQALTRGRTVTFLVLRLT
jgi:hypothetical protein